MSQLFPQIPLECLRLRKLYQRLITRGGNDLDEHVLNKLGAVKSEVVIIQN